MTMSNATHITILEMALSRMVKAPMTNTYGPEEQYVQTVAITSGDPSSITSLCSETTSALAGFLILQVFQDYLNVSRITSVTRFIYDCTVLYDDLPTRQA